MLSLFLEIATSWPKTSFFVIFQRGKAIIKLKTAQCGSFLGVEMFLAAFYLFVEKTSFLANSGPFFGDVHILA